MGNVSKFAFTIIPAEDRRRYFEITQADSLFESRAGRRNPWSAFELYWLAAQLRWYSKGFRSWRWIFRVLILGLLTLLYLISSPCRDAVLAVSFLLLNQQTDYRRHWQKKALSFSVFHFAVAFSAGLFAIVSRRITGINRFATGYLDAGFHSIASGLLFLSCITAATACLMWLVDFVTTRNVLARGKLFALTIVCFIAIQWFTQASSYATLIGADGWFPEIFTRVSKLQQVTTNLVLPLSFVWSLQHVIGVFISTRNQGGKAM